MDNRYHNRTGPEQGSPRLETMPTRPFLSRTSSQMTLPGPTARGGAPNCVTSTRPNMTKKTTFARVPACAVNPPARRLPIKLTKTTFSHVPVEESGRATWSNVLGGSTMLPCVHPRRFAAASMSVICVPPPAWIGAAICSTCPRPSEARATTTCARQELNKGNAHNTLLLPVGYCRSKDAMLRLAAI